MAKYYVVGFTSRDVVSGIGVKISRAIGISE